MRRFEHTKRILKRIREKIFTILSIWTDVTVGSKMHDNG